MLTTSTHKSKESLLHKLDCGILRNLNVGHLIKLKALT